MDKTFKTGLFNERMAMARSIYRMPLELQERLAHFIAASSRSSCDFYCWETEQNPRAVSGDCITPSFYSSLPDSVRPILWRDGSQTNESWDYLPKRIYGDFLYPRSENGKEGLEFVYSIGGGVNNSWFVKAQERLSPRVLGDVERFSKSSSFLSTVTICHLAVALEYGSPLVSLYADAVVKRATSENKDIFEKCCDKDAMQSLLYRATQGGARRSLYDATKALETCPEWKMAIAQTEDRISRRQQLLRSMTNPTEQGMGSHFCS